MSTRAVERSITLVEAFRIKIPLDEFKPLIDAALGRIEREGVASLISVQFYTSAIPNEMGAVLRFSSPDQVFEHIDMISGWEEFKRFSQAMELLEIRVFGELHPKVEAWMSQFNGPIKKFPNLLSGFVR